MNSEESHAGAIKAIMIGGSCGALVGAILGGCVAVLLGFSSSSMGGFIVVHLMFAMMLMCAWSAPCFVTDEKTPGKCNDAADLSVSGSQPQDQTQNSQQTTAA